MENDTNQPENSDFDDYAVDKNKIFAIVPHSLDAEQYRLITRDRQKDLYFYADKNRLEQFSSSHQTINLGENILSTVEDKGFYFSETIYNLELCSFRYHIDLKISSAASDTYYIIDGYYNKNAPKTDIDIDNPDELAKLKHLCSLSWPSINGREVDMADKLQQRGFYVEKIGRSGFANRNSFVIKTKEGILDDDSLAVINQAINELKAEKEKQKENNFIRQFAENSPDPNKTYAVVSIGGTEDNLRIPDGYSQIADVRTACTQDHRQGHTHTYAVLFIHDETMMKDKRRQLTLYVPKDMIGLVIGKGGSKIKELGKKYNKFFKIEQSPTEKKRDQLNELDNKISHIIYSDEIKDTMEQINNLVGSSSWLSPQERESIIKNASEKVKSHEEFLQKQEALRRENQLFSLKERLYDSFGEKLIDADDEQIKKGVTDYLQQNKETLTFMPTVEELNQIDEQLRTSRDNKIQMREFQKQEEIQNMADSVRQFMDVAERDGKIVEAPDVDKYIKETFADSAYIQSALEAGQKEVQRRAEERLIREEAAKNFDRVVNEEFDKFLNNPRNTGVHGVNYFSSVGRSRRTEGYRSIAYATGKRLKLLHGSYDDVSHYTHPDYDEFINLTNKVRDVEENRPVIDVNDYIVNPDTYSSYTEEQELEDNPIELTPEEKEARKQMLKSAKAAAKKDMSAKGQKTKQTTTIKGGLAGLAALLSEREK